MPMKHIHLFLQDARTDFKELLQRNIDDPLFRAMIQIPHTRQFKKVSAEYCAKTPLTDKHIYALITDGPELCGATGDPAEMTRLFYAITRNVKHEAIIVWPSVPNIDSLICQLSTQVWVSPQYLTNSEFCDIRVRAHAPACVLYRGRRPHESA